MGRKLDEAVSQSEKFLKATPNDFNFVSLQLIVLMRNV